jgi:hypothetical protein
MSFVDQASPVLVLVKLDTAGLSGDAAFDDDAVTHAPSGTLIMGCFWVLANVTPTMLS